MKFLLTCPLLWLAIPSPGQSDPELRIDFTPKSGIILAGRSISFKAGFLSGSVCGGWDSEYSITKKEPSGPDTFQVSIRSTYVDGPCLAWSGFVGPGLSILAQEPGVYFLRFDSAGEFKADLADTVFFTAVATAGPHPRPVMRTGIGTGPTLRYRLNGERAGRRDPSPVFER